VQGTEDIEEALDAVRRGERDRFVSVIRACHVPVRALISALVQDLNDADDLAQQTFVFAFQHLNEYTPGTHFLAWLKAVARNNVLDYLKRRGRQRANQGRFLREEIARRAGELTRPEEIDPRLEMLKQCVQGLDPRQRVLLRQAHDRSFTLDEMARRLRRSAAALRKQISRLYEALRQCIDRRQENAEAVNP
jgi:RNA polymerase sigma-70 factor (ECF subfamily)